jgi:predicted DNA-binding ribbon-helix-helix protein
MGVFGVIVLGTFLAASTSQERGGYPELWARGLRPAFRTEMQFWGMLEGIVAAQRLGTWSAS